MSLLINKILVNNKNGVALIVTLAIISILLATALHLAKTTGESVLFTIQNNDAFIAKQMALSGINLAKSLLIEDANSTKIDSVQEKWALLNELKKAVNKLGYDDDAIQLKINDELGKLQINALISDYPGNQLNIAQRVVLERFFDLKIKNDKAFAQRDSTVIVNSLKDWLDSMDDDAVTGLSGAESEYYSNLESPYPCANSPFNHVSELLNVNGLTGLDSVDLDNFFTIYGLTQTKNTKGKFQYSGKININTANADVLASILPEGIDEQALDLVNFRDQMGKEEQIFINTLDKGWYEKVINLSKKEKEKVNRLITYSSNIFNIECIAKKNDVKITIKALMKRKKQKKSEKWICQIIQMEYK